MSKIIGRKKEIEELLRYYDSDKPEFVAIYGRRRVGKTFLVKEVFKSRFAFHHTGLAPYKDKNRRRTTKAEQLRAFYYSLLQAGMEGESCPKDWMQAFHLLESFLDRIDNGQRIVVFIDELPWMDTPRAGFMPAFDQFWNGWCNYHDNVLLIVCGSATSWMMDNIIMDTGGMFRRTTDPIHLDSFTLAECESFYKENNIILSRQEIVEGYMVMGGIPYYMSLFMPGLSLAQNIDRLFFQRNAKLAGEFDMLFSSIFTNPDQMKKIIIFLSRRHSGFTRDEIAEHIGKESGGWLTGLLKALESASYIVKYIPLFEKKEDRYKLSDQFCWFWLHYLNESADRAENFWQMNQHMPSLNSWRGLAFEEVCFNHITQIKGTLGISGVHTNTGAYRISGDSEKSGMQMDMIIDRDDNVLNLCEIKFVKGEFEVTEGYYKTIGSRITAVSALTSKNIHSTLITTEGLKHNAYRGAFQTIVTLDGLFRE